MSEYLAGAMTMTPWGKSSQLRARRLRPGTGTPREKVIRNQRERLFGATIAVVAEKGYEAATVADVVELSGVSRSDFYEHFADKEACFLATVEALVDPTVALIEQARPLRGEERIGEALAALMRLIAAQPASSRVCFIELHAAGPKAEAAVARGIEAFVRFGERTVDAMPGREHLPREMSWALIGGIDKIIQTRLHQGREAELEGLAADLLRWGFTYEPPPEPLRALRRAEPQSAFPGYTTTERIARAVAGLVAERGYREIGTAEIAERASISLSTFYAHFADKHDAVMAALEISGTQMVASVMSAARRAGNWRSGVRLAYEAMFAFMAAEPAYTQLATNGVYALGAKGLGERDRVLRSLAQMLGPGYEERPGLPPIFAEAIAGSVYSLVAARSLAGEIEELSQLAPLATYITLAPFIGVEAACEVANGDGRAR